MSIVVQTLVAMGSKLLTASLIEKVVIWMVEELVKRTSSKADDKLLEIVKGGLNGE